ncbi:MAG: bacteriohemerythrin [Terriglobales bacterium]
MNFDQAAISHIEWKERLVRCLHEPDTHLDAAQLAADDQCPLGQWLHQEREQYSSYPEYATLAQHHTRFHQIVGGLVRGVRVGLSVRPETLLGADTDFGKTSAAVLTALMSLKRLVEENVRGKNMAAGPDDGVLKDSRVSENALKPVHWIESYSVGVAELDEHHQYFFCLLNILQDAIGEDKSESVVEMVLNELLEFARYHFTTEEELMRKANYPGLARHSEEHAIVAARLAKLKKSFQPGEKDNGFALLDLVRSWLVKHFEQADKEYSAYLRVLPAEDKTQLATLHSK